MSKSLAAKLLNNPGLVNLTTPEEREEIKLVALNGFAPSVQSRARLAQTKGHRIIFAFFQDDFQGGQIPYWHVCDPTSKSYGSTLSVQGLRDWKVIR